MIKLSRPRQLTAIPACLLQHPREEFLSDPDFFLAHYDIAADASAYDALQAQVVGLGKDVGKNKDHSWFVSYAPAFKPEIAVLALIENSGFGSRHAAPAVRAIYDVYFDNTGRITELPDQIAHLPVP